MAHPIATAPTQTRGGVAPQDLTATVLHCLGYSPDAQIHDALGRPLPISRGEVIQAIL